ncbi:MAG: DUF2079 domain-containing protein [Candidatus Nitrosocaldaceae archaeon]
MIQRIVQSGFFLKLPIKKRVDFVDIIVIAIIVIVSILYSMIIIHKHEVYSTYAWDLGIFAQTLRTTLEGKFMYHTPQLYLLPNGNHMFIHFTPILLLLIPFYALVPSVYTLLVIKSFITFFASYPLYLISKKFNDTLTSFFIVIIFISNILLTGALWFDFQFAIFLPLFIFMSEYAYISRRKALYVTSIVLLALVSEQGALYSVIILIIHIIMYVVYNTRRVKTYLSWLFNTLEGEFICLRNMLVILTLLIIYYISVTSLLEYAVNEYVVSEFREHLKAYGAFAMLGYKGNILSLPTYALTHPNNVLNALTFDYNIKVIFIILVYGILSFIPLLSIYGILSTFFISILVLSNYRPYYTVGAHYPYYYIGFIFLGFVIAISRLKSKIRILVALILFNIFILISFAPWSSLSPSLIDKGLVWYPTVPPTKDLRAQSLDNLIKLIDEDKSLLTQNHIFTHTSLKDNVYVLPPYDLYQINPRYFDNYINNITKRSEFILIDTKFDPIAYSITKNAIKDNFGIYAEGYNAILLKRNYYDKRIIDYSIGRCENMLTYDFVYKNEDSIGLTRGMKNFLVYGPYKFMTEGSYVVTYEIKAKNISTLGAVAVVDVSNNMGSNIFAKRVISGYELSEDRWAKITLSFNIIEPFSDGIEFRVYSLGNADLEFKGCNVERVNKTSKGTGDVGMLPSDLIFNNGSITKDGFTLFKESKSRLFWYGPMINIKSGVYFAELYLKIEPEPTSDVIDISILYNSKSKIVTANTIDSKDLVRIGYNWYIIRIPFILNEDVNDLEIVGNNPNSNYTITISHINIQGI